LLRLISCCVAATSIWACGPVFIPVPPPGPAETTFTKALLTDSTGTEETFWITSGGPDPKAANAVFYIFDREQNAGVIAGANPDGAFQGQPMRGTEGDHVFIHYQDPRGALSASACVLLSELRPTAAVCP